MKNIARSNNKENGASKKAPTIGDFKKYLIDESQEKEGIFLHYSWS